MLINEDSLKQMMEEKAAKQWRMKNWKMEKVWEDLWEAHHG